MRTKQMISTIVLTIVTMFFLDSDQTTAQIQSPAEVSPPGTTYPGPPNPGWVNWIPMLDIWMTGSVPTLPIISLSERGSSAASYWGFSGAPGALSAISSGTPTDLDLVLNVLEAGDLIIANLTGASSPVNMDLGAIRFSTTPRGAPLPGDIERMTITNTGNIGINQPSPVTLLHIEDGSVLFEGGTGGVPIENAEGTRLMWISQQGALRAGQLGAGNGSHWNLSNIGENSVAFGLSTRATGDQSFAIGQETHAEGSGTVAAGLNSNARADNSTAIGLGTFTDGDNSLATGEGSQTMPTAKNSIAAGFGSIAEGSQSIAAGTASSTKPAAVGGVALGQNVSVWARAGAAFGTATQAFGISSMVMGSSSESRGNNSFAGGAFSRSIGAHSLAFGEDTETSGIGSAGFGEGVRNASKNGLVIGQYNDLAGYSSSSGGWLDSDPAFLVGNGTSDASRSNAFVVMKNADVGININRPNASLDVNGKASIGAGFSGIGSGIQVPANGLIVEGSVGVGESAPANNLDVNGNAVIGSGYSGTVVAPSNSLLVENKLGVRWENPDDAFQVNGGSKIGAVGLSPFSGLTEFISMYAFDESTFSTRIGHWGGNGTTRGSGSVGIGYDITASNEYAVGVGYSTIASGEHSLAAGYFASASGDNSVALGVYSAAIGFRSIALGVGSQAYGDLSTAIGGVASGDGSFALSGASTFGRFAFGFGQSAKANGEWSMAMGNGSETNGELSFALGKDVVASTFNETALGVNNEILSGSTTAWVATDPLLTVGNGGGGARSTALTMLKNGHLGLGTTSPVNPLGVNGGVAVGQGYAGSSVAPSNGMIVEGSVGIGTSTPMNSLDAAGGVAVGGSYSGSQTAPADGAIIEGAVGIGTSSPIDELHVENGAVLFRGNTGSTSASGVGTRFMWVPDKSAIRAGIAGASGWDAASIGSASAAFGNATTASGTGSVAMGYGTEASGDQSTALGYTTTASGSSSFSAGLSTSATGDYAAAFGTTSDATGESSFAQGDDADATKDHAIAMGEDVDATGVGAVAIGKDVEAAGDNSIAIGVGLKTPGYRSVAVGSYNVEPTGTSATSWGNGDKPLFTVGASQTPNLRQNGFVVQKNGNTGIGLQVATDDINNDLEVYGGAVIGKNHSKGSLAAPTDGLLVEGLVEIGDNGNTVGFSLLDVYGNARSPSWGSFSDARMKSNIEGIENALVRVRRMRAVSYDLRSGIDASSRSLGRQMGFIAQELAEIEPSLVDIGEDGVYSVYYGNVTALLAQAISEMDEKLDAIAPNTMRVEEAAVERSDVSDSLRLVVSEQESRIQALEEFVASLVADQSVDARRSRLGSTSSILYQNRPNPFSDETTIGCFVPETASSARIEVTQVGSGVVVRRVPVIGRGDVEIVVSSHGLSSGSYSYSLIVDGIEVDTRLMEITR